jgi:hypothetical protein
MFHPGGFGGSDYGDFDLYKRKDPPVLKPVLLLVSLLLLWVICFMVGLSLGFGWYAWPSGTVVLLGVFLLFNFVRRPKKISKE